MNKNLFEIGFQLIDTVRGIDRELKRGKEKSLAEFFSYVDSMRESMEDFNGESESAYDFLGAVVNIIFMTSPSNKMLTERMYQYYMIGRLMELFGDHEAVGGKVYITDKNVEEFINESGERDAEKLLNVLSQAGEVLSCNMRGKLNTAIRDNLSKISSATIYFAVTNGAVHLDKSLCSRLGELCVLKKCPCRTDRSLFEPEYVVKKLKLYGYLNTAMYEEVLHKASEQ